MLTIDREIDARGLNCPLPILRTKKALNDMTSGQTIRITATDPAASVISRRSPARRETRSSSMGRATALSGSC